MPRLGKVRLRPEAPDRFFTFEFDLEFAAERDAQKGVSQLVLRPSRMQPGASARRVRNPV